MDELQRRLDAALTPYDPATAHALAAVRAERDELRGRAKRLDELLATAQGELIKLRLWIGGLPVGTDELERFDREISAARTLAPSVHPAIPEGTPTAATKGTP